MAVGDRTQLGGTAYDRLRILTNGEIDRGEIAGMVRIRRQADHGDGTAGGENAQAVVRGPAELGAISYGHFSVPYL